MSIEICRLPTAGQPCIREDLHDRFAEASLEVGHDVPGLEVRKIGFNELKSQLVQRILPASHHYTHSTDRGALIVSADVEDLNKKAYIFTTVFMR